MPSQTSDKVSRLASHYAKITPSQLVLRTKTEAQRVQMAQDLRTMAMSLLRQDEHKGLRGFIRKVTGL